MLRQVLGIVGLAVFLAAMLPPSVLSADRDEKDSVSAQPNVNITPRVRVKGPDPAESIADRRADIRVDTTLVLIPVAVTDPMSRFVTGLERENFKVFEDKVEQEIEAPASGTLVHKAVPGEIYLVGDPLAEIS